MKQLKITKFPELDYAGSEAFNTLSTNLSFSSLAFLTSLPQSGHLPSTSCVSVQNDSQGVQYQPSYSLL